MASELKPCPLCQYKAHEWIQGNKKMACCDNMDCPCRAIVCTVEQWNTRPAPAATDTGLVTVAWESMDNKSDPNDKLVYEVKFPRNGDKRLVYQSQAEELLAEKDERLKEWQNKWAQTDILRLKAEADNEAKDARIKELDRCHEGTIDLCNQKTAQIEALEAKLAAAEQAARVAHETLIEINPSNYNHDDVCQLNDASVEAIFLLADILGETHGKTKEWWDERRAVLGGKPS